ncbi:MAG: signal peptidase II [Clostridia bacterium]|nr:signal peptidase II [Clostridia bacterium]
MYWVLFIIALIGLDQWTKWFIFTHRIQFENLPVIKDFFYLTYLENRGAAFGILQNFRWGFILLTLVALVAMVWYFRKNKNMVFRLALSFLFAGAVGNFIDRLFRGFVVDFFHFYPFGYDFAVFNVADVWVNIAVALLVIFLIFIYKEPQRAPKEPEVKDEQPGE